MFRPDLVARRHPVLDLNFMGPALDPAVTFVRTATAAYYDAAGVMQTAASGAPRFDYDPTSHTLNGLLLEDSRTNLCLRNSSLNNAVWTKSSMTVTLDVVPDPAGTTTYDLLTASAGNGSITQAITVVNGVTYALSFDAIRVAGAGDFQITSDGGTTWATVNGLTTSLKRFTYSVTASGTTMTIGFRLVTSGDQVGVGGVQVEKGSYASSRIATLGVTVTRDHDILSLALPAPFYRDAPMFAVAAEVMVQDFSTSGMRFFRLSDGSAANSTLVGADASGTLQVSHVVGSTADTENSPLVLAAGSVLKLGMVSGPEGIVAVANGNIYRHLVDRPLLRTAAMSSMDLSPATNTGALWLRRLRFWRDYVAPEMLAALTGT